VKSFCYNYTIQDAGGIYGSYFSPNGTTLGIAHTNSYVNFWDKYNKTKIGTHNYGTWADRITYSKNGKYIAVGGQKNIIHILNSTNFAYILSINTGIISVAYKADFRYDDKLLLICGSGNQIQFWNVPAWTLNKTISLPSYSPYFDC
jgi:WD40 repeat protein